MSVVVAQPNSCFISITTFNRWMLSALLSYKAVPNPMPLASSRYSMLSTRYLAFDEHRLLETLNPNMVHGASPSSAPQPPPHLYNKIKQRAYKHVYIFLIILTNSHNPKALTYCGVACQVNESGPCTKKYHVPSVAEGS